MAQTTEATGLADPQAYEEALSIARSLPKAEMHLHLDGSLLPSFLFKRAAARGCRDELPSTAAGLRAMVDDMKADMRRGAAAGHSGVGAGKNWPIFDLMNRFLQTSEELEEAARGLAAHLAQRHSVRYLELRFCPALHTTEGLTEEAAVRAVRILVHVHCGLRPAGQQRRQQAAGEAAECSRVVVGNDARLARGGARLGGAAERRLGAGADRLAQLLVHFR